MYINDDGIPMEKKYDYEESDPLYPIYTLIHSDLSGTAENGKAELSNIIGKHHGFDTVKPVQLMKYFIQTFMDKNDIFLDFFQDQQHLLKRVLNKIVKMEENESIFLSKFQN